MQNSKCWMCDEVSEVPLTQGFGTDDERRICGICVGTLAVVNNRLNQITRHGQLQDELTASTNIPEDER